MKKATTFEEAMESMNTNAFGPNFWTFFWK